jgi:hypothetical protein
MKKFLIAAAIAAVFIAPLQTRAATVNFSFDFSNTSAGIEIFGEIDGLTVGATSAASQVIINSYTQTSTIYTFPVPIDMTAGASQNSFTVDATGTLLTAGNFSSTVTFAPNTTLFLSLTRAPGTDVAGIAQRFTSPISVTDDIFNATDFGKLDYVAQSSTPLPATLPLFATGLGALGLLDWRRKRKAAALAA